MADPRTHLYANNAASLLHVGIDDNDTTIQLTPGSGALFPNPSPGEIFKLTLQSLTTGDIEICNCTARSTDALTVERGQESTTPIAWTAGALAHHRVTAETLVHIEELTSGIAATAVTIQLACSDLSTDIETGANKAYVRAPRSFTLLSVRASLLQASSSGPVTINVNNNGVSILSTKVTIDEGELTSLSAVPSVISDDAIANDDALTIDFDAVGPDAQGVIVTLLGTV